MKRIILGMVLFLSIFMFSGCTHKEEVPSGTVGKMMTKSGFKPEILQPGWYTTCDLFDVRCYNDIYLLDTTTGQFQETVTVRMKDNMDLKADYVRVVVRVKNKPKILNALFNDIKPDENNFIPLYKIYGTYGKAIVIRDVREVLSQYTLDEVRLNYKRISGEIFNKIQEDFKSTPLEVVQFNPGRFNFPKTYNDAILLAKQKELEIKKIEAENIIKLKKIKAQETIAKAQYNIKMQEAKRISDYNKMLGKSVTPQLLELRKLEVQQAMVEAIKNNPNVIYMPYSMMNNSNTLLQIPSKK